MAENKPAAPSRKKVTIPSLVEKMKRGEPIVQLAVYDYETAIIADRVGIDILCVSDTGGMVLFGHETTTSVSFEEVMFMAQAVKRGSKYGLRMVDMPYMSFHLSAQQAENLRIGHMTAKRIEEYRRLGYGNLEPRQLGDFGIHGVTPQYIEELRALGYRDIPASKLIEMKILFAFLACSLMAICTCAARPPTMNSTFWPSMSSLVRWAPTAGFNSSSRNSTSTFRPSRPPLALSTSTASCAPFC